MTKTGLAVLREVIPQSPVFTTRQAASAAGVTASAATRDLGRMAEQGLITRIVPGLWADTKHPDFTPYALVPHLVRGGRDAGGGYVSLLSALSLHGMIEQIPRVIHVVARAQRHAVSTPIGDFAFHQIDETLFGGFVPFGTLKAFNLATPAKALFDTLYLSVRRARRFSHLPELTIPGTFRVPEMERWIRTIEHPPLRAAVSDRWMAVRSTWDRVLTHSRMAHDRSSGRIAPR